MSTPARIANVAGINTTIREATMSLRWSRKGALQQKFLVRSYAPNLAQEEADVDQTEEWIEVPMEDYPR